MSSLTGLHASKGLEGVVATTSSICYIDGDTGVLAYRGYDIHELADNSTFEEVCYLLWFGRLPNAEELKQLKWRMAEERKLDASIIYRLQLVPKHVPPMDVLRTLVSTLSYYDPGEHEERSRCECEQGDPADIADFDAGGELRPDSQGQADGRARPVALARGEFSADAEWRSAFGDGGAGASISR